MRSPLEDVLNLTLMKLFSLESFGRILASTFIVLRAFPGKKERNRRAVFARGEKGLKAVVTSVKYLVIISAGYATEGVVLACAHIVGFTTLCRLTIIAIEGKMELFERLHVNSSLAAVAVGNRKSPPCSGSSVISASHH